MSPKARIWASKPGGGTEEEKKEEEEKENVIRYNIDKP